MRFTSMRSLGLFVAFSLFGIQGIAQDSILIYRAALGRTSELTESDKTIAAERCIELAVAGGDIESHLQCRIWLSRSYYNQGQPWEAERILLPAIELATATNDTVHLFDALLHYTGVLSSSDRPNLAWEVAEQVYQLAEASRDTLLIADTELMLGRFTFYYRSDDYEGGMKHLKKSLHLFEKLNRRGRVAAVMESIGQYIRDAKQAEDYTLNAIEVYQELNNKVGEAWAYFSLGLLYAQQEQIDKALAALEKSRHLHTNNESLGGIADVLLETGNLHLQQKNYALAIQQLEDALQIAQEIPLYPNIRDATARLSEAYAAIGDYASAFRFSQLNGAYKDSTFNETLSQQIRESNDRFESERKNQQITAQELALAQQKNVRNQLLYGSLVLLLLTAGTFQFFLYRQRQRKREVEIALASEAKEAERLRAIDELKTNFFTNVSHELRTPLTLITSPLEEVLTKVKQVNLRPDLERAHQNSQRLLGLINEILDLSKLEAGELAPNFSEINLHSFLRRVFFSFQSAADLKQVTLTWDVDNMLPQARVDVPKLEKILNNLISNALKFTPPNGEITLWIDEAAIANKEEPILRLRLSDTGQGIHPDDLPHIFDRFYQSSQKQPQGGTGIGLSLSHQLASLLGGQLAVESTWQQGSTFELTLPVTTSLPKPQPQEPPVEKEKAVALSTTPALMFNSRRPQVMIVEDNPEMSNYLLDKLRTDYDCHLAENGAIALRMLEQQEFDLIISDVMMPVMDGFGLREAINRHPAWKRIPFLLLTARTLPEDKIRGFQLGIDDYVTKPFSLPELKARAYNLLENKLEREIALAAAPESPSLTPEEELLQQAEEFIRQKLDDTTLSVEELAKHLGYSQRNLSRILTQISGLSPVKFILELRLQQARHLLETRQFATVSEVRYEIGIESASYFTSKFKKRFGCTPTEYL